MLLTAKVVEALLVGGMARGNEEVWGSVGEVQEKAWTLLRGHERLYQVVIILLAHSRAGALLRGFLAVVVQLLQERHACYALLFHGTVAPSCYTQVFHPDVAPRCSTQMLHPDVAPRCSTQLLHVDVAALTQPPAVTSRVRHPPDALIQHGSKGRR